MKKYEILEHKADLKIRVFGKTKREVYNDIKFKKFSNTELESEL